MDAAQTPKEIPFVKLTDFASFRFIVNEKEFSYEEIQTFQNDNGWDTSVLDDRAKGTICRAIGNDSANRMGFEIVQGLPGFPNEIKFHKLPKFSKNARLEVTVRIITPDGE